MGRQKQEVPQVKVNQIWKDKDNRTAKPRFVKVLDVFAGTAKVQSSKDGGLTFNGLTSRISLDRFRRFELQASWQPNKTPVEHRKLEEEPIVEDNQSKEDVEEDLAEAH